jgi:hypothetical protein
VYFSLDKVKIDEVFVIKLNTCQALETTDSSVKLFYKSVNIKFLTEANPLFFDVTYLIGIQLALQPMSIYF